MENCNFQLGIQGRKAPFPTTPDKGFLSQTIPLSPYGALCNHGNLWLKTPFPGALGNQSFSTPIGMLEGSCLRRGLFTKTSTVKKHVEENLSHPSQSLCRSLQTKVTMRSMFTLETMRTTRNTGFSDDLFASNPLFIRHCKLHSFESKHESHGFHEIV